MVLTRLRAAVIASGEGVWAAEMEIDDKKMHAMIKRRLAMVSSDERSGDGF
jgi:hypothetical protein